MKTLVVDSNGRLGIWEIPKPKYNSKQALVKTISCGICGTDDTLIKGHFKGFPSESYPIMLGHEGVGQVLEIGSEVKSFKKGDYVLLPFTDPDIDIYGELGSGWGAFSEYGIINDLSSYEEGNAPEVAYAQQIIPDYIDPVDAVMIVTLREVLSNIKYFGIGIEDTVVVYGSGPVAVTFVNIMNLMGVRNIIGVARNEEKKKILLEHGATQVINSKVNNPIKEIKKLYPNGVKYVLDAVGSPNIINEAMALICDRGEILCYGVPKVENMNIDWSKAPYNWKINFQQMPRKEEEADAYQQILEWIQSGRLNLKDFISDYFEFNDILLAFEKLANNDIKKKAIIRYI